MRKLYSYSKEFVKNPFPDLLRLLLLDLIAALVPSLFMLSWYLWIIVLVADLVVCFAQGAWSFHRCKTNEEHKVEPYKNPINLYVRVAMMTLCLLVAFQYEPESLVATGILIVAWYASVIVSVTQAFRCILKTMHATDPSWLLKNGGIGIPNWISILRIAFALLAPHIFYSQIFGNFSNFIAGAILALAIFTDVLDGFIARKTEQTTKAGKALDPLGDKFIFYPNALALMLLCLEGDYFSFLPNARSIISLCVFLAFARDALFLSWFFLKGRYLKHGIGAGFVDKARMLAICLWLGFSTLTLIAHDFNAVVPNQLTSIFATCAYTCIVLTGILSLLSVLVDSIRIRNLL